MGKSRASRLKHILSIGMLAYRKSIRKGLLKVVLVMNLVLFILAFLNNMPSMALYIINMYYINKFMQSEYPETKLKRKDRYEVN